ncbi:ATP synthase F1 subunit epsilon [Cerasicoccus arenae]|uniref:ATP synthase epsilon chain n=1 Tax=Cerasicoccus arenae TaxID=424488 RepID=A0A8J3D8X7_9BACT|nr:ATP synthase F1 subunit epsilon [Cerasicoccus arenae]MBK1858141.1 ATP synthase F1 subunit epsilon [Cerasicoccus arenae]GHB96747.1 ATP synthase epsilon chain [Cerasicoccus arenae]
MALKLEIVTPEKIVYSQTVDEVVLPTAQGEIDILPGHQPLLTMVEGGEVTARGAKTEHLAIDKGFARVQSDTVSILTEAAIDTANIDVQMVEEAQRRAEEALKVAREENVDPAQIEQLEQVVRFAVIQKLAKKKNY